MLVEATDQIQDTTPSLGLFGAQPGDVRNKPLCLLGLTQDLSYSRTLDSVIAIVREKAREFAESDGVTFVLRDHDHCHYVEENAIGPLWKGRKFPLNSCISGWVMEHKEAIWIEDIYKDPRIPIDAYRPTFVQSLAMVPIRRQKPVGAIGVYWAEHRQRNDEELRLLQALADSVSIAMENVSLYHELQSKVKLLQESNHELSRFAWVASHDLQEPLRTITTQVELLARRYHAQLDTRAKNYMYTATQSARRLQHLVEDLLVHARIERSEHFKPIVMGEIVHDVLRDLNTIIMETNAHVTCTELPWIWGEQIMICRLFQNLISNALKFHRAGHIPHVQIACRREVGNWHFTVSDNGIGIEADQRERIFGLFQRVHAQSAYPGSGIGLATCRKIVELHGGTIWVESVEGEGSTFHIVLPVMGGELGGAQNG